MYRELLDASANAFFSAEGRLPVNMLPHCLFASTLPWSVRDWNKWCRDRIYKKEGKTSITNERVQEEDTKSTKKKKEHIPVTHAAFCFAFWLVTRSWFAAFFVLFDSRESLHAGFIHSRRKHSQKRAHLSRKLYNSGFVSWCWVTRWCSDATDTSLQLPLCYVLHCPGFCSSPCPLSRQSRNLSGEWRLGMIRIMRRRTFRTHHRNVSRQRDSDCYKTLTVAL